MQINRDNRQLKSLLDVLTQSSDESVQWLRLVLNNLRNPVFLVDRDSSILYVSPNCEAVTGWSSEELLNNGPFLENLDLYVLKEDQPRFLNHWRRTLAGETIENGEYRAIRKDGSVGRYFLSWEPVRNNRGEVIAVQGSIQDESSRGLIEEALKESEERYRNIFNSAVDGICVLDLEGKVLDANPAFCSMLGYTRREMLKLTAFDLTVPSDASQIREHLEAIRDKREVRFECIEVRKDGTVFPIEARAIPYRLEGRPAMLAIIRDISDRVGAEEALRESESKHRALVELANDSIVVVQDNKIVFANPRSYESLGYTHEEMIGRPFMDFVWPDELPRVQEIFSRRLAGEHIPVYETATKRKDGSRVDIEVSGTSIIYDGRPAALVLNRDITERKRAQEKLRDTTQRLQAIIDNDAAVIYSKDFEGRLLLINNAYERIAKVSRRDIIGQRERAFLPPDVAEVYSAHDREVIAAKAPLEFEEVIPMEDGVHTFLSVKFPLKDTSGEVYATCGISTDITERKRSEEELRRLTAELEAILKAFPDLYFRLKYDGTHVGYSASNADDLYLPPEQFMGKRVQDVFPAEAACSWDEAIRLVKETRSLQSVEYTLPIRGEDRNFEARLVPILGDQILAIVRNITEHKRAEEASQASEEQFRALSNSAFEAIAIHQHHTVVDVNQAFVDLFGYSREETIGMSIFQFAPAEYKRIMLERVRTGYEGRIEGTGVRKDGSTFPVEVRSRSFMYRGTMARVTALRDITERKMAEDALARSETKYRELVEDIADWVWEASLEGIYTYISPAVERVIGYSPEELVGASGFGLVIEEDLDRVRQDFANAVEARAEFNAMPARLLHKDGSIRYVESSGTPIYDHRGQLAGYRGVTRDVTERATADEEKRRFYRTAISAFTDGKMEIVTDKEAHELSQPPELQIAVSGTQDVASARHMIRDLLRSCGLSEEQLYSFVTAVGEAINNSVKHAGGGNISAGRRSECVWVSVCDDGPGIEHLSLPRAILERGYSTKLSLGLGYSIMLDAADRVYLATGTSGTHVILEKNLPSANRSVSPLDLLPDTW